MVTKVSSTEFENMWNSILKEDSIYHETHYGTKCKFSIVDIERNKPEGWKQLKELISEIEKTCVVYYSVVLKQVNIQKVYVLLYMVIMHNIILLE